MSDKNSTTTRIHLFARPSFLTGVARLVDVFGSLNNYNTSPSDSDADYNALYSDWAAVGDEIERATERYKHEIKSA